jgi:hypothetical protein
MSQDPGNAKPRQRRTQFMIEMEKRKILEYIQAGATDIAIMEGLHIPRKMFERRIQSIREGHMKQVLDQQGLEAKASALMVCQEKMKWLEMQAQRIVMDVTTKPFDKLQAMDRVRQFQIDYVKLLIEGPTIFQVVPRDGLHNGSQRTSAELRDAPLLPTPEPAANPERQF